MATKKGTKKTQEKQPAETEKQIVPAQENKPKQTRKKRENWGMENIEPGDNARYLRDALVGFNLPPIDISDAKQVEKRIFDYFEHCNERDRKPNIVGLSNWIGVDRSTIHAWARGEYRPTTHRHLIKKALTIMEEIWADYMMNGKVNPASGIFIGKNHFNYKDNSETVLVVKNPLGDERDTASIADKYKESMPKSTVFADFEEVDE